MKGGEASRLPRRVQAPTSAVPQTHPVSRLPIATKRLRHASSSNNESAPSGEGTTPTKTARTGTTSQQKVYIKLATKSVARPDIPKSDKARVAVVQSATCRPTAARLPAALSSTTGLDRAPRGGNRNGYHRATIASPSAAAAPSTALRRRPGDAPTLASHGKGTTPVSNSTCSPVPSTSGAAEYHCATTASPSAAGAPSAAAPRCRPDDATPLASHGKITTPLSDRTSSSVPSTSEAAPASLLPKKAYNLPGTSASTSGISPSGADGGFITVRKGKKSQTCTTTSVSENTTGLDQRSTAPCTSKPMVGVARHHPPPNLYPAFRVPTQEGYETSYDAVAALEEENPQLKMKNVIGRDGSSVLLPKDEDTYRTLDAMASEPASPVKLIKLDPQTQLTKGVVMGFPLRMPLTLLKRHPQVEEATRCITSRSREETRQVIITVRGTLPPHLDLPEAVHTRATEMFPLPAFWPSPDQLFPLPDVWNLQRTTQHTTVPRQVQGKAAGDTQMSQLQPESPCMEPQLSSSSPASQPGPRAASIVGPGTTKLLYGPRPPRNLRLGTATTSQRTTSANSARGGLSAATGASTAFTTASTITSTTTQPPSVSPPCFSTSVTALPHTGHLAHYTRASAQLCHGAHYVSGHSTDPDLGDCGRPVGPRIDTEKDSRPDGGSGYREGAGPYNNSFATADDPNSSGTSYSSAQTCQSGNGSQLLSSPGLGGDDVLSTTHDYRGQLRLCQWNCRGFRSQYASLLEVARRDKIDLFLLQETLLPLESTATLPGYRAYHCPRAGRAGGGLTILARYSIDCHEEQHPISCGEGVEVQAVTLHLPCLDLQVYNIYRPPTADLDLNELFGLAATEMVLVAGDFNAHHPWLSSPTPSNRAGRQLYTAFEDSSCVTLLNDIQSPTHVLHGRLDLAFASSNLAPTPTWSLHPTLMSDHFGVVLGVAVRRIPSPCFPPRFNMRRADWGLFRDTAEELLRETDLTLPLEERVVAVNNIILQAARCAIPLTKPHTRYYRDAWIYGPRVRELNRRVNTARKSYRHHPSPDTRCYLKSVVRHVQAVKTRLREEEWLKWCRSVGAHTPLGEMWRRVRAIYSPRPPPPPTHPTPQDEADRLARLFAARTSPLMLPLATQRTQTDLADARAAIIADACAEEAATDAPFTMRELDAALCQRSDTAPGLDKVTYSMLCHLGAMGRNSLLTVFNMSLEAGSPPAPWKVATITPIPKPKDPGSMRPISLLSCPGKILERMVLARLKWQVGELHHHLFAFQSQRSTTSCLMTLLGSLRLHSGLVVFLDLEKAFEMASPPAILEALAKKGVKGRLLQWLRGFLTGRSACVKFQGHLSTPQPHTLGTPQGSCLSPFLFNILMETLVTASYGHGVMLLCYADDLALVIPKHRYQECTPRALELLRQHCSSLGLKINPEKSCYMTFGLPPLAQPLRLGDVPLQYTTTHQYLGVWFNTTLSFRLQVKHLRERATARLRVLHYLSGRGAGASVTVKRQFYTAAIRSVLDYSAPCLPGLSDTSFRSLEVVQNEGMRAILGAPRWTSVVTLRKECGLASIKNRILARASVAVMTYLRRWPATPLANQLLQALEHPPAVADVRRWVHAAASAASFLGVDEDVRCDPDLPLPDHLPPPPWAPPLVAITKWPYARPKALLPARLRQETLSLIASCSSPSACLYYTDGSVGEGGSAGAAFVSGALTVSHRLPPYTTAFQAELTAILLALHHASERHVCTVHLFSDSLSALLALCHDHPKDNVQLLSAIHMQLTVLYRSGTTVTCHWIPGHVGVSGNERADAAARLAGAGPRVTFSILRSTSSIKATINRAALTATHHLFDTAVEEGSRSASWYSMAT